MTGRKDDQRQRVAMVGEALREGLETPTDTYITGDIPLLLTRLGQIPAGKRRGAPDDPVGTDALDGTSPPPAD